MKNDLKRRPYYTNVKVRGVVVGTLHLLGSELADGGAYCFLFISNGTINALTYMVEGMFDEIIRLADKDGKSGNTFIGKRRISTNPALIPFVEKLQFMKHLAENITSRVEAQHPQR